MLPLGSMAHDKSTPRIIKQHTLGLMLQDKSIPRSTKQNKCSKTSTYNNNTIQFTTHARIQPPN